jgi:hypothetical protein
MLSRIALTVAAAVLFAAPAHAQKEKKPALGDFPFWAAPKTPHAKAFVPGLQAALGLTPEQIEKIAEARLATVDSEEIRALKKKGDPNATAEELAVAAARRDEATEKLHAKVGDILTKDQKALVEKLNDAYARVVEDVTNDYQQKLVDAKGNAEDTARLRKEMRESVVTAYEKKLDALLGTDQREAVRKAAAEEAKRGADSGKVKPKK